MTVSINTKNEASITPRTVLTDFISDLSGCTTMTTKILRTLKASSTAHMERQCLHSTLKRNNNRNSRKKAIESSCKVFYRVPADGLGGSLLNRRFWPSFRSPRTYISWRKRIPVNSSINNPCFYSFPERITLSRIFIPILLRRHNESV